jgi:hypothetical protein
MQNIAKHNRARARRHHLSGPVEITAPTEVDLVNQAAAQSNSKKPAQTTAQPSLQERKQAALKHLRKIRDDQMTQLAALIKSESEKQRARDEANGMDAAEVERRFKVRFFFRVHVIHSFK